MGLIRQPHLLKPTKNARYPTRIIFVDTETVSTHISEDYQRHDLKLGVACYLRTYDKGDYSFEWLKGFRTPETFWDWSLSKCTDKQRVIIMAHNLDFDFLVLNGLNELEDRRWYANNIILSGQVDIWNFHQFKYKPQSKAWVNYVLRYKKEPSPIKTLLFLDLMNYFKMSLKKLGESMGVEKLDIDFDKCSDEELLTYCTRDVEIMAQAWLKWTAFLKDNDLGCWGKTLPSQALSTFRHKFMKHEIYIHSHEPALHLERQSYCGGRTECFQIGKFNHGPYYLVDVNSLYPSVMYKKPYPTRIKTYLTKPTMRQL